MEEINPVGHIELCRVNSFVLSRCVKDINMKNRTGCCKKTFLGMAHIQDIDTKNFEGEYEIDLLVS